MSDPKYHSILSPSGAESWTLCAAKLAACKGLPNRTNAAAQLGSAKHALAKWVLQNPDSQTVDAHVGQTWYLNDAGDMTATPEKLDSYRFTINDEFCDHVNMYVNGVRGLGGDQTYEQWVSSEPLFGIEGQGGTLDMSAEHVFDGVLDIADAKFGFGPVSPNSKQLKIYAGSKLAKIDPERAVFDKVRLHIFQPKLSDVPRTHPISVTELYADLDEMRPQAQLAHRLYVSGTPEEIEAAKNPSDEACEWCDIRLTCQPRLRQLAAEFPIVQAPPTVDRPITFDPALMNTEQLDNALSRVDYVEKFIRDWATGIRAEGLRRAQTGTFPGWKVIQGKKGARAVPPADKANFTVMVVADLGEAAYEKPELKSPTQLEATYKRLKRHDEWKTIQAGWVVQAPGAPSLARETEPGAPMHEVIANEFGLVTP